jgi:hypothetical protein
LRDVSHSANPIGADDSERYKGGANFPGNSLHGSRPSSRKATSIMSDSKSAVTLETLGHTVRPHHNGIVDALKIFRDLEGGGFAIFRLFLALELKLPTRSKSTQNAAFEKMRHDIESHAKKTPGVACPSLSKEAFKAVIDARMWREMPLKTHVFGCHTGIEEQAKQLINPNNYLNGLLKDMFWSANARR